MIRGNRSVVGNKACQVTGAGNLTHIGGLMCQNVSFRADIDFDYEPQGDRLVFSRTPIGLFAESVFAVDSDTNRWVNIVVPGSDDEDIRTWLRAGLDDYFEDRWGKNLRLLMPLLRIQRRNDS